MRLTKRSLLHAAAAGGLALAGCTGAGPGDEDSGGSRVEETSQVSMVDSQFDPRNIHVDAGTTVTWTNEDGTEHTVTSASDNWSFDEPVPGGESVDHTFGERGVYDVYCRNHGEADLSGMSMRVGVGDATIETPLGGEGDGGSDDGSDGGGGYY